MRWINIKNGIKQRLSEILGVGSGAAAASNTPTYWSIQAAMLENLRRIVKSIVGDSSVGRPMKGCWIAAGDSKRISITEGFGCTPNGDIVVLPAVNNFDIGSTYQSSTVYIYLKHTNAEIPYATNTSIGKNVTLIGQSGSYEIVNDDSGVDSEVNFLDLIYYTTTLLVSGDDYVYLGSVVTDSEGEFAPSDIVNTKNRGLSPNSTTGQNEFLVPNLRVGDTTAGEAEFFSIVVNGSSTFHRSATFNDDTSFAVGKIHSILGELNLETSGVLKLRDSEGSVQVGGVEGLDWHNGAVSTLTVRQGIVVGVT